MSWDDYKLKQIRVATDARKVIIMVKCHECGKEISHKEFEDCLGVCRECENHYASLECDICGREITEEENENFLGVCEQCESKKMRIDDTDKQNWESDCDHDCPNCEINWYGQCIY